MVCLGGSQRYQAKGPSPGACGRHLSHPCRCVYSVFVCFIVVALMGDVFSHS